MSSLQHRERNRPSHCLWMRNTCSNKIPTETRQRLQICAWIATTGTRSERKPYTLVPTPNKTGRRNETTKILWNFAIQTDHRINITFMPIKRQKKRCWLTYYPTTISQYPTKASGKVAKLHRSCCWTEIAVGPKSGKNCLNNYWSNGNCLGDDVKKVHLNSIKFDISPEDNAVGYWHIISFLILPNCFVVTLILSRKPQTSINGIRKIYLYRKRFWKLQCHQLL